jgi:hypothetical protein
MALMHFFQHFPGHLPPKFLTQLFAFFEEVDPECLPSASETLLEYILLLISTGLTAAFSVLFPAAFFSAALRFCEKSPKLDKQIERIAAQEAPPFASSSSAF